MKQIIKHSLVAAAAMMLVACGGGGDNAGSCKYGTSCTPAADNSATKVSTGVASQSKMSFAVDDYALDWLDFDAKAAITVRIADTAGNPLPAGTKVNFVAEAGTVSSTCTLVGKTTTSGEQLSECSVDFSPLSNTPADGYATVLVYLEGEEAYLDLNGDHAYTAGEPYYEGGTLFRDDNESFAYESGSDMFLLSAVGSGTSACRRDTGIFTNDDVTPYSPTNSCDGKWGKTYVRAQIRFPISTTVNVDVDDAGTISGQRYVEVYSVALGGSTHVSPVSGTSVAVSVSGGTGCTVNLSETTTPKNSVGPRLIQLIQAGGCSGATATITVVSGGTTKATSFTL